MKMIDLIAAATVAFMCTLFFFNLWSGITEMHADTLRRMEALGDASMLVSNFRETTAAKNPPDNFPVPLPTVLRGISAIHQTATTGSNGKPRYTLVFTLLGKEYAVHVEADK